MRNKKVFEENKRDGQKGSAIVLMVLVLINALIIVSAIASISLIEGKMSSNIKNSTPAFQAADSGIEWVLKKISDETDASKRISEVFGSLDTNGKLNCPVAQVGGVSCELYFVDMRGALIVDDIVPIYEIDSVRSIGKKGSDDELVSRAVEVSLALAGCPSGYAKVSDFCIETDEHRDSDGDLVSYSFEDAMDACFQVNARLCSASEWVSACQESATLGLNNMGNGWERVDDLTGLGDAILFGSSGCNNSSEQSLSAVHRIRCCINMK
jgi:Tfp pilus assembly protein PilX